MHLMEQPTAFYAVCLSLPFLARGQYGCGWCAEETVMQTFTSITMEAIGSVASAWDDSRTARGGSPSALV